MDNLQISNEQALEYLQSAKKKKKPKPRKNRDRGFEVEWVQFPMHWAKALRQSASAGATYQLAIVILAEAFRQQQSGQEREIVLSSDVTGMPRNTKAKAIRELVRLKLIQVTQSGRQSVRVIKLRTRKNK